MIREAVVPYPAWHRRRTEESLQHGQQETRPREAWRLQLKGILFLLCKEALVFTLRRFYYTAVINTPTCSSDGSVVVHLEVEGPEQGPAQKAPHVKSVLQRRANGSDWCFLFLWTCSYWPCWVSWPLLAVARLGEVLSDLFKSVDLMNKSAF